MKHEVLSRNAFTVVPKFHRVFLINKKMCLQRKDIFWHRKFNI